MFRAMGIGIDDHRDLTQICLPEQFACRINLLTLLVKSGGIQFDRSAAGLQDIQDFHRPFEILRIVDQPEFFRQVEVADKGKFTAPGGNLKFVVIGIAVIVDLFVM